MAGLRRADLIRFFRSLGRRLPSRLTLVLTGGGEAMLLGGARPTADLDFGLHPARSSDWPAVEAAVAEAAKETGVVVQYSQDIDRWSAIAIPVRRRRSTPFRRFGRLTVRLLDPGCWAVYKLARYLDSDVEDLIAVLRSQRVQSLRLARLCGECLRSSPRSPSLFAFRKQVEHFLTAHGVEVWGRGFDSNPAVAAFRRAARIA